MKFTFGILGGSNDIERINKIIDSIEAENIPEYEIVFIGNENIKRDKTSCFEFDHSIKPHPWITKQKNIVTQKAKYENVVYLHDYLILLPGWYAGHLKFGNDFTVCMDKIVNVDGSRFRDWTLDPYQAKITGMRCLLPYDVIDLTRYMYISGSYWVAKKDFMLKYPQDNRLYWGCAEDMKWSAIVNKITNFSMNIHSTVKVIKEGKSPVFVSADIETINRLRADNDTNIEPSFAYPIHKNTK